MRASLSVRPPSRRRRTWGPADDDHLGGLAVDEPEGGVVPGEAHPVARAQAHGRGLVELEPVAQGPRGVDAPLASVGVGEVDMAVRHPDHPAGVAGPGAHAVHVVVEHRHVARAVVRGIALLRAGEAQVDVALELELRTVERALLGEPLAHRLVDVGPERVRGREQGGALAKRGVEVEPEPRGGLAEGVGVGLEHAVAERLHREPGCVGEQVQHRGLQAPVALAQHLVHARGGKPRVLEQREGLAGLDRGELPAVADECQARDARALGDAHQRAHLHGAHHRRLVEEEQRAA